ncbi:MAG: hypothetical protein JRI23_36315 [Deltaproteobacteria bacterium]|nr:hypothetical protein [Deltaproteobacteria bacterium]MBW2537817.1 hypothetical protein [Deltaproteobacteria bacterium]
MKIREVHSSYGLVRIGAALAVCAPLWGTGCVDPPQQPNEHIGTRRAIPVSVCTTQLAPPRRTGSDKAVIRSLDPEQWLEVMVPKYEPDKGLNPTDVDCTGHYLFANEPLRYGISKRGWPRVVDPEELEIRSGPEGMRVVWLRSLTFQNGDVGGPVALVRAIDDRAEVYGIGAFRGPADAKLTPVRMGNEALVVAETKRCPDPTNCRTLGHFFLVRRGRLLDAAVVDLERVARVPSVSERGLYAEYHLRTDVNYDAEGVLLLEQVRVKIVPYEEAGDRDSDRTLRTVEFSRRLKVERDTLFATNESLWERVVGQD